MTTFDALGLSAPLLRSLEKHEFKTPTDIQAGAIPPLMEGRDVIGLAETGTGKTAAFLLPMLHRLIEAPASKKPPKLKAGAPRALVLAPTRELAQQIGDALNTLSGYLHLRSAVIYGGAPMHKQLVKLKAGVDILIATPGRLMDHMRRGSVRFDETEIFVLDEADRMLDMGFVGDVKIISKALPVPHQTVLFSATINKSVEGLTKILLKDPVRVDIARKISVAEQVEHYVLHLQQGDKKKLIKQILQDDQNGQTIIFTKTKWLADKLARDLAKTTLKTDAIHGDRNQRQRQRTLNRFRTGAVDILVATDVAARGIDVPGIARVINYDLPLEPEAYVHRVGRTGRNGAAGIALSLCTPEEIALLRDIERLLKQSIAIDADHAFHVDPPARVAKSRSKKPNAKKSRAKRTRARRTGQSPSAKGSQTKQKQAKDRQEKNKAPAKRAHRKGPDKTSRKKAVKKVAPKKAAAQHRPKRKQAGRKRPAA